MCLFLGFAKEEHSSKGSRKYKPAPVSSEFYMNIRLRGALLSVEVNRSFVRVNVLLT
jgi:hypothetical protein